jgi:SAM-dependent methyltransferase
MTHDATRSVDEKYRELGAVLPGGRTKEFFKHHLPLGVAVRVNALVTAAWNLRAASGVSPRECNMCGYRGKFVGYGRPMRLDARCTSCGSLERHRLFKLWLDGSPDSVRGKDVLHFAPEPGVAQQLRPLAKRYASADIDPHEAELQIDIENMALPDRSFDCVVCFHVLEHVNDALALKEMYRILRPGGVAVLMTPVIEGWSTTYENPAVSTPAQRRLHFGQEDHVRYFGADIRQRIRDAGFDLDEFTALEPMVSRYGLTRGEKVFLAIRPD